MTSILVVEDDKAIAKALELRLKSYGYEVATAADASTATTVARRCSPDVALLDISMPGGDGFDVAERLRSIYGDAIDLIFITASSREDLRERAAAFSPKGYFRKPFAADELIAAVAVAA